MQPDCSELQNPSERSLTLMEPLVYTLYNTLEQQVTNAFKQS